MVSIKIIQGLNEIGGNCIRIEDKDQVLLFDQGMRFSTFNQYYSHRVEPRGIPELRQLKIIPPAEAYQDISAVYITHFHLDHLGLLAGIPGKITVKLPSLELFQVVEKWYKMSPTWLAYIPPRYTLNLQQVTPLRTDKNNVMAVPVEHSSYPAYAYLYFGSDATILYTGDLRIKPISDPELHKELYTTTLLEFLREQKDIHVDHLILEGTNLGTPLIPLTGNHLRKTLSALMKEKGIIAVAIHNQEIETLLLVAKEAKERGRELIIASSRIAELIDFWLSRLTPTIAKDIRINVLASLIETPLRNLNIIDEMTLEENVNQYVIIADLWHMMDSLRTIDPHKIPPGSPAIILTSEPRQEEAVYSEALALRWLRKLRLQPYRLRISGHYYPYQLKNMIKIVNPKEVTPIHTLYPEQLYTIAKASKISSI